MSESRDLLQGERRIAYDYVTVHRGIYGDDIEVFFIRLYLVKSLRKSVLISVLFYLVFGFFCQLLLRGRKKLIFKTMSI